MTIKRLPSGYWHARIGRERFAQWPAGSRLTSGGVFPSGWWSEEEIAAANKLAAAIER